MTIFSNKVLFFFLLVTTLQWFDTFATPKWVSLEIVNKEGVIVIFETEIADTEKSRILGLSPREGLGENEGLLLDFGRDLIPRMWMKNTRFSLDMLFIDSFGKIRSIYSKAVPLSLRIISPNVEVRYVLEISGGQTDRLGIQVGDEVRMLPFYRSTVGLD